MPGEPKAKHEFEVREITELCRFTIERNELGYKSLQQALEVLGSRDKLDLIARALPVVDSPLFKQADAEKARLRSLLKTAEQSMLVGEPKPSKETAKLPWTDAKKLFQLDPSPELFKLMACVPAANVLYAVGLKVGRDRHGLQLIRIPLSGEKAEFLSHADLEIPPRDVPPHLRWGSVTGTTIDEHSLYVAISGAGIFMFPLGGEPPRRFSVAEGLPSNYVLSVAVLDGKVYAGFADGYLAAIDPQTGQCDVLASSRRKQKLSPFDDGNVFRVPTLVADPARQRLVFVVGNHVWQLTPADGKITPLIDLVAVARGNSEPKLGGETIDWSSRVRDDRVLVMNVFHTVEIDLAHDRAVEIHAPEMGIFRTYPPQLVIDGWLWCGGEFARLSLDTHDYQALPSLEKKGTSFRPTVCLELTADERQLIAVGPNSVWLYDLARAAAVGAGSAVMFQPRQQWRLGVGAAYGNAGGPFADARRRFAEALDHVVEDRRQKLAEQRHAQHAAEDSQAQRASPLHARRLRKRNMLAANSTSDMPQRTRACSRSSGQPVPRKITPRAASIIQVVGTR